MQAPQLTIEQTATGYWMVQRAGVPVAGAMTRQAAERELETLLRLGAGADKRAGERSVAEADTPRP
jgi:hypothetical protein